MAGPPPNETIAADWSGGVLESFYRIAFAKPDMEVAGVLVGQHDEIFAPRIDAVIPFSEAGMFGSSAAFSHDGWSYVHRTMARHYPGLAVVGWYVSRPGMGTDLSPLERQAHQRWFPQPHQVALIIDSRAFRGALFGWHLGELVELHEGPIARRYTFPRREGVPWRGYAFLAACGAILGAGVYLLSSQALDLVGL